jgi:hypothetical protein
LLRIKVRSRCKRRGASSLKNTSEAIEAPFEPVQVLLNCNCRLSLS